eukprot:CAMPEP_0198255320 /NCGR_PEP_ID=MMETSP1447-20131203/5458_1 /TAXON_ID=420782 /ORGANISM="Chaetoceros dichaeta, Strain CCMP1751" /LENGTH=333 /DNA_ID=CAMNT_0043941663 /DNA_START=100 /DNA_END=1101 /DNA_ORIENTATION=-
MKALEPHTTTAALICILLHLSIASVHPFLLKSIVGGKAFIPINGYSSIGRSINVFHRENDAGNNAPSSAAASFAIYSKTKIQKNERRVNVIIPLNQAVNDNVEEQLDDDNNGGVPYRPLQDVMRFRAVVAQGYGRGGKKLGFPTANLESSSLFRKALEDVPMGVYFGWAVIEGSSSTVGGGTSSGDDISPGNGRNMLHKAVVNVGYSPTFDGQENQEKIIEAHLILDDVENDIKGDFYNETMRLALSGFLRAEQKFPSFPDLIKAINNDVSNARNALEMQPFVGLRADKFVMDPCRRVENSAVEDVDVWVGTSGGNECASYEFQDLEEVIAAL